MEQYLFSFKNYRKLLKIIKSNGTLRDYTDVLENPESSFIILRHDIEFSPKRALDLAKIEHEYDIKSTYFVQVSNNAYNILSGKNIERLKQIHSLGHHIGLHFHLQGSQDLEEIQRRIIFECDMLSNILGIKIDRFSFHRPSKLVLENEIKIPGLINAYSPIFFTYTENVEDIDFKNKPKYVADSRNEWSYIAPYMEPCEELFKTYPKVQLLCHPYTWTENGGTKLENLKSLIEENRLEFIYTLNEETKYVKEYIDKL